MTFQIFKCEDLPAMDAGGTSDPYVRVWVNPDKKKAFCTKKLKKTLNPVYNETFTFLKLPFNEMDGKVLIMAIYDHDALGSDDQIGEGFIEFLFVLSGETDFLIMSLNYRRSYFTAFISRSRQ